jgi:hypothetical protein
LPEEKLPIPSKTILDELKAGWPTGVVYSLISELHDVVGTDPPDWLKHPEDAGSQSNNSLEATGDAA